MISTVFWIFQILAGAIYMMAGIMKFLQTKEKLITWAAWVEDFSITQIRMIGMAEFLGGLGLILPRLTGIMPILTPIAAACLVGLMAGAIFTQVKRKDNQALVLPAVLLLVTLVLAIGLF